MRTIFKTAFTIQSDTRYLSVLRAWVFATSKIVGRKKFPKVAIVPCTLALIEAVDNAIFHAHDHKRQLLIGLEMIVRYGSIVIVVSDLGIGIGHHGITKPDEMTEHGRGLFLIHKLMSRVDSGFKNEKHFIRMVYRHERSKFVN